MITCQDHILYPRVRLPSAPFYSSRPLRPLRSSGGPRRAPAMPRTSAPWAASAPRAASGGPRRMPAIPRASAPRAAPAPRAASGGPRRMPAMPRYLSPLGCSAPRAALILGRPTADASHTPRLSPLGRPSPSGRLGRPAADAGHTPAPQPLGPPRPLGPPSSSGGPWPGRARLADVGPLTRRAGPASARPYPFLGRLDRIPIPLLFFEGVASATHRGRGRLVSRLPRHLRIPGLPWCRCVSYASFLNL